MSEKLPRLTAKEIIKILAKWGFVPDRQKGSHKIYITSDGLRATVPIHSNKILHPKIVKTILRDANKTVTDLKKDLK